MRMCLNKIFARHLFWLLIVSLLPAFWLWGSTGARNAQTARFPGIQATSLDNARLHLPQDFSGQLNLVVVSFAREQQHDVDGWIPAAREIQTKHPKFSYYELPTMSSENLLYRWWFDAALRNNTNDHDLRNRTLTAYVNKHKFLKALGIANEKQVVAMLVDRTGKIYWRANGNCTEEEKLSLMQALAANQM